MSLSPINTSLPSEAVALKKRVAVVGGGFASMQLAIKLIDAGHEVHILEASSKGLGGLLQERKSQDGEAVNPHAEFFDEGSDVINLCKRFGIPLVKAEEQETPVYQMPDGKMMSNMELLTALQPIVAKIQADKEAVMADPTSDFAKYIDSLSPEDYLKHLAEEARREGPELPFWKRATTFIFGWEKPEVVPADIIRMAAAIRISEDGQDVANISALHFLGEASENMNPETGSLMASGCDYRIADPKGTRALVDKMQEYLVSKGAHIHLDARTTAVRKENGKFNLTFEKTPEGLPEFDQVAFGVPSFALAKIEGLEALGLSKEDRQILAEGQYTHSSKAFVGIKPEAFAKLEAQGIPMKKCFYSSEGYQAWNFNDGKIEFLIGGQELHSRKGGAMVQHCMASFAKSHGMTVDQMFDTGDITFCGYDPKNPGYSSPGRGQMVPLMNLPASFEKMSQEGAVVVGSFVPQRYGKGVSVGFLDDAYESCEVAFNQLQGKGHGRAQEQELNVSHNLPPKAHFTNKALAGKNPSQGMSL